MAGVTSRSAPESANAVIVSPRTDPTTFWESENLGEGAGGAGTVECSLRPFKRLKLETCTAGILGGFSAVFERKLYL